MDISRWFDNLLAYIVYTILLRLVGIWPSYDKMHRLGFLEHGEFHCFSVIHVSQGSVATAECLHNSAIANFLLSLSVKEFLKSVKI